MLQVLSAVNNGIDKPTRIMYAANLSWSPCKRILSELVEKGLLKEESIMKRLQTRKIYEITEKGINVLQYYKGAGDLLNIITNLK